MPQNRKAIIRYKVLDKCLNDKYQKYYIEDLVDRCNEALMDAGIQTVSKRQIQADIAFMKSCDGWSAPIESVQDGKRKYLRYRDDFSIMNAPVTEMEIEQLETLIASLSRLQGIPLYDWIDELLANLRYRFGIRNEDRNIICFEQNPELNGLHFLPKLINCIIKRKPVVIEYHPFEKNILEWTIHPYYLKQHNNRWFLFGYNESFDDISVVALDRISKIQYADIPFVRNKRFDFDSYFRHIVGVSIEKGKEVEHVRLKFSKSRLPYVLSKPIHQSQLLEDDAEGIIALDVIPNKELISELIWFHDDVEVLAPESLRDEIKEKISKMYEKYFGVKNDCTTTI